MRLQLEISAFHSTLAPALWCSKKYVPRDKRLVLPVGPLEKDHNLL